MNKIIFSLIILTSIANAAPTKPCPGMLGLLHSKDSQNISVTQESYIFAKDALAHYRSNELGGYNNRPYIESFSKYLNNNAVTGFKIVLTDGGDESNTTYYLNAKGKLVYAKYDNQSPVKYWFCGQKTALEIYE